MKNVNPFPHIDAFWHLCSRRLFENIVTKEKIAQNVQFLFLPQCFPLLVIGYPFNYRDFFIIWQNMFKVVYLQNCRMRERVKQNLFIISNFFSCLNAFKTILLQIVKIAPASLKGLKELQQSLRPSYFIYIHHHKVNTYLSKLSPNVEFISSHSVRNSSIAFFNNYNKLCSFYHWYQVENIVTICKVCTYS